MHLNIFSYRSHSSPILVKRKCSSGRAFGHAPMPGGLLDPGVAPAGSQQHINATSLASVVCRSVDIGVNKGGRCGYVGGGSHNPVRPRLWRWPGNWSDDQQLSPFPNLTLKYVACKIRGQ